MTDIDLSTVRRSHLPHLLAVFLNPRVALAEVVSNSRATWVTPISALSITGLLAVLVAGYLKTRAAMSGEIPLPPDWEYWLPEMQNNYMQAQQATQGPVFMYIIPLVGAWTALWLGWVVFAGLLHLGSTLLGGRGSMQGALNLVAWGSLPFAIRDILRVVFMLLTGHAIISPGFSGFASEKLFISQLLARTDIFLIWNIVLLVSGLAIADKLPKGKSLMAVMVVVLIALLVQAGISSLGANLSGTVVQRPFF